MSLWRQSKYLSTCSVVSFHRAALLALPCRTSKVKDGRERWRVVYLAFSYSDGTGVEFGSYPQQHGAKHEQWFMKPEPGKVCGMNG
jgi:hypothetical protein